MGTPWWTGETGTSGVNSDFHNTSDNLCIRLIPDENGILQEKNLIQYGREIEEIAVWINNIYPQWDIFVPNWYLYDSEENGRASGDGWELETNDTIPPGTGFLTLRKLYTPFGTDDGISPASGFNQLINLDRQIQNYYDDVMDNLDHSASGNHPSGQGFYQRFYGTASPVTKFGPPLTTNIMTLTGGGNISIFLAPNRDVDFLEGINFLRPKAPFFVASEEEGLAVISIYNLLGPMFSFDTGIDNKQLGPENLLGKFHLRDENLDKLSGITAIEILRQNQGSSTAPTIFAAFNDNTIRAFDFRGKQLYKYDTVGSATSMAIMDDVAISASGNPQVIINNPGPSETFDFSQFNLTTGTIGIYYLSGDSLRVVRTDTSWNFIREDSIRIEDPGGTRGIGNIPGADDPSDTNRDMFNNDQNVINSPFNFVKYGIRKQVFPRRASMYLKKGNDIFLVSTIPKGEDYETTLTLGNSEILIADRKIAFTESFDNMSSTHDGGDAFMILKRYTYPNSNYEFTDTHRVGLLLINGDTISVKTVQPENIVTVERTRFNRSSIIEQGGPETELKLEPNTQPSPILGPLEIHVEQGFLPSGVGGTPPKRHFVRQRRHLYILDYDNLLSSGLSIEDQEIIGVGADSLDGVETYISLELTLAGISVESETIENPLDTTLPTTITLFEYDGQYPIVNASGQPIASGGFIDDSTFFGEGNIIYQNDIDITIDSGNPTSRHSFLVKLNGSDIRPLLRDDGRLYILAVADIGDPVDDTSRQSLSFDITFFTTDPGGVKQGNPRIEQENTMIGGEVIYNGGS